MRKSFRIVSLLTKKSLKILVRQRSVTNLALLSSLVVCGSLYLMWWFSTGQTVSFMTSSAYSKLSFDLSCQPRSKFDKRVVCKPVDPPEDSPSMSSTDFLFNILQDGSSITSNSQETRDFAGLLSSIMMNGLPLLGLDDFVYLSDFVNTNLGSNSRAQLLKYPGYRDKFGNFLEIRTNQLRITPRSAWSDQFLHYLNASSTTFSHLNIRVFDSMEEAMSDCCDSVWAILDITPFEGDDSLLGGSGAGRGGAGGSLLNNIINSFNFSDINTNPTDATSGVDDDSLSVPSIPAVTIRMHPAAIPDTRNFEWSPLQRSAPTRQQSGQLLYFLSGFLSLQIEIQNFLTFTALSSGDANSDGSTMIETNVFKKQAELLLQPSEVATNIAQALFSARNDTDVYRALLNSTSRSDGQRPSLFFPLYHRAFPTHDYEQSMFWHVFGVLVTIALTVYFSLPAALVAGAYRREQTSGLLDILSTFPAVKHFHSLSAWCVCCAFWVALSFVVALAFFAAVLEETNAMVPAVCLLLFGCALGPFSMVLGEIIQNADAVVVAVPSVVFVTLLPGLLYFDLAFDVQRSFWLEMLMCLLPASAVALALRLICATESIFVAATWRSLASVSGTPIYAYAVMLLIDIVLYSMIAYVVVRSDGTNVIYKHNGLLSNSQSNISNSDASRRRTDSSSNNNSPKDGPSRASSPQVFEYSSFNASSRHPGSPVSSHSRGSRRRASAIFCSLCTACSSFWSAVYHTFGDVVAWMRGQHAYTVIPPAVSERERMTPAKLSHLDVPKMTQRIDQQGGDDEEEEEEDSPSSQHNNNNSQYSNFSYGSNSQVKASVALSIRYLTKQRTSGSVGVIVLSNITTVLKKDCVTLLLGSNGAGKTTLMKILGGIDSAYSGEVSFVNNKAKRRARDSSFHRQDKRKPNQRAVGWCPQNDALFDLLSVQEHLELFTSLMDISTAAADSLLTRDSKAAQLRQERLSRVYVNEALQKLSMTEHRDKRASALSGGMKRRLSLALSFIGNPAILVLDEPTSGCDAYTRELVRKDILTHKNPDCAVLLSTHHTDDIEVLADHVWFLNDRFLEYDDSVDNLAAFSGRVAGSPRGNSSSLSGPSKFSFTDLNACGASEVTRRQMSGENIAATSPNRHGNTRPVSNLEFTTWDESVRDQLASHVGQTLLDSWLDSSASRCDVSRARSFSSADSVHSADDLVAVPPVASNVYVWVVIPQYHELLFAFITRLECDHNLNWSLSSSYAYKALCHLYDDEKAAPGVSTLSGVDSEGSFHNVNTFVGDDKMKTPERRDSSRSTTPATQSATPQKASLLARLAWHVRSVFFIRWLELKSSLSIFLLAQLLVPFLVVLAVTCSCRDVTYPKVELTSTSIRGIGEIPISQGPESDVVNGGVRLGREAMETHSTTILAARNGLDSSSVEVSGGSEGVSPLYADILQTMLNSSSGGSQLVAEDLTWAGRLDSDEMYVQLYSSYYAHKTKRWGSVILQDTVPQWVSSTILIDQGALSVDLSHAFAEVLAAQREICGGGSKSGPISVVVSDDVNSALLMDRNVTIGGLGGGVTTHFNSKISSVSEDLTTRHISLQSEGADDGSDDTASDTLQRGGDDDKQGGGEQSSAICGDFPSTTISLRNYTSSSFGSNTTSNTTSSLHHIPSNYSIAINSYESLRSNLTMLTNVTTDHAAPVFLKEVIPAIYSALCRATDKLNNNTAINDTNSINNDSVLTRMKRILQDLDDSSSSTPFSSSSSYVLYSHPLLEINYTNEVYIERGFLGSTIIVLYLLITTITTVRFVTKTRSSGMKTQLHIAGIHPVVYWCGNMIFDASLLCSTLFSIYLAVFLGGDPISKYFFPFPPAPGVLFLIAIICFSYAVTASSYCFTVLSTDQLSSQLFMLISSVVTGGFLKLYLDTHRELSYVILSHCITYISPSFAFSTALFGMFKIYAIDVTKNLTGVDHSEQKVTLLQTTHHCIFVMFVQCFVYLFLCIVIDMYYKRVLSFIAQWRWYYSTLVIVERKTDNTTSDHTYTKYNTNSANTYTPNKNDNDTQHDNNHIEMTQSFLTPLKSNNNTINSNQNNKSYSSFNSSTPNTPPQFDSLFNASLESISLTTDMKGLQNDANTQHSPQINTGQSMLRILHSQQQKQLKRQQYIDNIGIFPVLDTEVYRSALLEAKRSKAAQGGVLLHDEGVQTSVLHSEVSITNQLDSHPNNNTNTTSVPSAQANALCVEYPRRSKLALCNLSFSIPAGSRVALMGMNGGGKSTLFKTFALGQNTPLSGSLSVCGRDIVRDVWAVGGSDSLGYVPQEGGLLEFLTVKQTIELYSMIKLFRRAGRGDWQDNDNNKNSDDKIVSDKYLNYPVYALSGGTKKKLLIQVVNLSRPSLLCLDECTTGVDPIAADRIMRYLKENIVNNSEDNKLLNGASDTQDKQSLLFSSHRIDESLSVCDRVLMLVDGQTYLDGDMSAFHALAYQFYQIDVLLDCEYNMHSNSVLSSLVMREGYVPLNISLADFFLLQVAEACKSMQVVGDVEQRNTQDLTSNCIERVVVYSPTLLRLTFEKRLVSMSHMWRRLSEWRATGLVAKHSFRVMDMEEVLATLIAASSSGGSGNSGSKSSGSQGNVTMK